MLLFVTPFWIVCVYDIYVIILVHPRLTFTNIWYFYFARKKNLVKIYNQLVKKVKKYGFSDKTQGDQIWFLQGAKSVLEKGQTKILGPTSVIWDQISEIWPQKG